MTKQTKIPCHAEGFLIEKETKYLSTHVENFFCRIPDAW